MALKSVRYLFTISTLLTLSFAMISSGQVRAMTDGLDGTSLPSLETFVEQVSNGRKDEVRGVYIAGILAAPIVQQPDGMDDFVSPWQNIVTQFATASKFGSTGLLAHNYLAGEQFALLQAGQEIHLVYGDGWVETFLVAEILRFQALDPASTSSTYIDLKTHDRLANADLFTRIYNRPGQVIFQTCIEQDGEPAWGRLFVIAESSPR